MDNKKDYKCNGVIYNLDNIWQYMEKDYWDVDDLKFDFWYRLTRHQEIFNKVMEINGLVKSNFTGNDNTYKLKQELIEKNKGIAPVEINWDFEWND